MQKLLISSLSTIWGKTDDCSEQYRYASELYLMSVRSHCYSAKIDWGISAPGHGKEVVDGLNAIDKRYIYQLMSNAQLTVSKLFYSQMQIHTSTQNNYVRLAKELQQHLSKENLIHCVIDKGKTKNIQWYKMDRHRVSCSGWCWCCTQRYENVL